MHLRFANGIKILWRWSEFTRYYSTFVSNKITIFESLYGSSWPFRFNSNNVTRIIIIKKIYIYILYMCVKKILISNYTTILIIYRNNVGNNYGLTVTDDI